MADDDLDILAWTMLGEAGGEGKQGMADVGHVVLNRVNSGKYGASIQDVALAPKQFSTWNSGSGGNDPKGKYPKDSAAFQRARQIAEQVVAGTIPGPPGKPLDYHASSVSPYWASSKAGNGAITRNGHVFYPSVPVPPGELPEVATALSTVPTPRDAPAPVTPSIDMAQMRRISAPSQLIPDTFAGLSKPKRNLGDELGMSPIPGGKQQAPLFDAGFDTRTNAMRLFSNGPADTQGVFTGASKAPAPVPRMPPPQLAAKRSTASLYANGGPTRPPTDQVGIAPTGRPMLDNGDGSVSTELSITITDPRLNGGRPTNIPTIWGGRRLNDDMAINSALASGQKFEAFPSIAAAERAAEYRSANEILTPTRAAPTPALPSPQLAGQRATDQTLQAALSAKYPAQLPPMPPATRSVPTTTIRPSASDMVRGNPMQTREQATTIASIPTVARPNVSASDLARGRSGISTIASYPTTGFPTTDQIVAGTGFRPPPAIPDRLMASAQGLPELYGNGGVAGVGTRAIAPTPFHRPAFPTQFAAVPRVAPVPFQRPTAVGTQLSTTPMPPMPIARPGIGGPFRIAPIPMPASMRPTPQRSAPPTLYYTNPMAFGGNAVSQSGDSSVGSQADAAAARSSGEGGRNRRY